jgi:predicted PurR-regulated permease PerM
MDPPPAQRVEVVVSTRTLLVLLAFAALVALAILSLGTLLSIFIAAVIAFGLDPVVGALVRRGWKRGVASLVVLAALFVSVLLIVLLAAGPVWEQLVEFAGELPAIWDEVSSSDAFQQLTSTGGADDTIRKALKDLATGLPEAATTLLGAAGSVFGSLLSLVTLTFLTLFLLMERPTISGWLFGFAPPETEARWSPVVEDSIRAVSSSLIGNVAAMGLPFPFVLAVITGLLDLIPQVGATIAAVILVAVALSVSTVAAVVMLVIQLIYQQVENYIIYPIVYRRAVELSGFTTIVAVLIAGSLLGVVGAILAVPFAAVIKVVLREAGAPRRARMAALREPVAAAGPAARGEPGEGASPRPG